MEYIREFLETSTIHGLSYISTTRKYFRLFWIVVVLAGFTGATFLICESFNSWAESPVITSVEIMPITQIQFPKVTVCPPKNTFTDLNYDLLLSERTNLTKEMRNELFMSIIEDIEDQLYLDVWDKLVEENRFYNWYYGYSTVSPPGKSDFYGTEYYIQTTATSGVIATQYYKEKYLPDLVERKLYYRVFVNLPKSVINNENVTLHLEVEKVSMTGLTNGNKDYIEMEGLKPEAEQEVAYKTLNPPNEDPEIDFVYIKHLRDVSSVDVRENGLKMKLMPGFKFKWHYTGIEALPKSKFSFLIYNRLFAE